MATLNVRDLGAYIRDQRHTAQMSVRQLAKLAGVSNPYLSQIERGMRKPSAEILQQIAKGLRISAEALYVQAGILDERPPDSEVPAVLLADTHITERQKQVLVEIYESFRRENAAAGLDGAVPATGRGADDGADADGAEEADEVELLATALAEAGSLGDADDEPAPGAAEPAAPRTTAPRRRRTTGSA